MNWLSKQLKNDIRSVFEPRYKRTLNDVEVEEIAENLSGVVEEILKLKWKEKHDNRTGKKAT